MGFLSSTKKAVLITGANGGIGNAIVNAFASAGYDIIAHKRALSDDFEAACKSVAEKYGNIVKPIYFDMTDIEGMKHAISNLNKEKTSIDVLINNTGIAHGGLFQMTSMKVIRDVFEVNFFTHLELTQLLLRPMIRRNNGCIINIGSISGLDLKAGNCAYGVSKAALMAWTKTLAAETGNYGVRVNAIAPGLTDTNMARLMEEEAGKAMIRETAMKRLAKTDEIAGVALFLASDQASFINGQVIRVDGGSI